VVDIWTPRERYLPFFVQNSAPLPSRTLCAVRHEPRALAVRRGVEEWTQLNYERPGKRAGPETRTLGADSRDRQPLADVGARHGPPDGRARCAVRSTAWIRLLATAARRERVERPAVLGRAGSQPSCARLAIDGTRGREFRWAGWCRPRARAPRPGELGHGLLPSRLSPTRWRPVWSSDQPDRDSLGGNRGSGTDGQAGPGTRGSGGWPIGRCRRGRPIWDSHDVAESDSGAGRRAGFATSCGRPTAERFRPEPAFDVPVTTPWGEKDGLLAPGRRPGPPPHCPEPGSSSCLAAGHIPTYDDPELVAQVILEGLAAS